MPHSPIPDGYAVAQLDKNWYPLQVKRLYSAAHPEGQIILDTFIEDDGSDITFPRRSDAIVACQQRAQESEKSEALKWQLLAIKSDPYLDRSIHYLDEIEAATGCVPRISYAVWYVTIEVSGRKCTQCGWISLQNLFLYAPTIEEALEKAANEVYAGTGQWACECQKKSLLLTA